MELSKVSVFAGFGASDALLAQLRCEQLALFDVNNMIFQLQLNVSLEALELLRTLAELQEAIQAVERELQRLLQHGRCRG